MSGPFEEMSSLDRLVHEPARLAILTALLACKSCDYQFLQSLTALTKGNLGGHLSKLEEGGLISLEKGYKGRVPQTTIRLTPQGRSAIDRHWRRLRALHAAARAWGVKQRAPHEE
ncbi:MAG: transcriptional regulator [Vicinamibacterales bacterium]